MNKQRKKVLKAAAKGAAVDIPLSLIASTIGSRIGARAGRPGLGAILGGLSVYPVPVAVELRELQKTARSAEFAPGIPSNRAIKPISIPKGFTRMVVQEHSAKRAGKHYDLRIHSGNDAHSWAIRNWPEDGGKALAVQQPTHTADYSDFEGSIPEGYGAGTVRKSMDEMIDVISADEKKIKFVIPGRGEFAMINTGGPNWLMFKMKPFIGTITNKPSYKDVGLEKIEIKNPLTVLQPKIDGAHSIIELNPGSKLNRIYSYRVSKRTGLPIEHTHQLPIIRDIETPKELSGTTLRAEVFARSNGKAVPAQEIGGILNSGLVKSRLAQDAGAMLVPMAFDVIRFKNKDVTKLPYSERFSLLERINKKIPQIEIPENAITPKEKKDLFLRISKGEHPDTKEGVVEWSLTSNSVKKAKIRPEFDVYIKEIDPLLRRFSYSLDKDGPTIGYIGTGISEAMNQDMHEFPFKYKNKVARVSAQEQFPSGALRAPSFKALHVEKNLVAGDFEKDSAFQLLKPLKIIGGMFLTNPAKIQQAQRVKAGLAGQLKSLQAMNPNIGMGLPLPRYTRPTTMHMPTYTGQLPPDIRQEQLYKRLGVANKAIATLGRQ